MPNRNRTYSFTMPAPPRELSRLGRVDRRTVGLSPPGPWHLSVTESVALPPNSRERRMADYRLYFLGLDGHFRKAEPIVAANDTDAMKAAREFTDGSELELWEGDRKIVAFGSDQPQIRQPAFSLFFKATFKRVDASVGGFR